ncbi:hypothetical protein [Undibacterium sp. TJN19]|uniref:hypothetical protein n=1 Tax=Undibacterium sp. TJN19 TaxID=3413055 RepID=UPI003BF01480
MNAFCNPMKPADVMAMHARLAAYDYEDIVGVTWKRPIVCQAGAATDASFTWYLQAVAAGCGHPL